MTYDAAGQRTSSVVTEGSVTTTTTYTYEGLTLLALEAAASDGSTSSVTYLTDASGRPYGGLYSSSESSPVAFGIVTTDRGDVVELTDSQGEPFARYAYDAYGTPTATESRATTGALDAQVASAIAGASVLRYASYCYDEHSGLYYLSQRYLDPATASFITKDPAKADGEESAYQYCGGDPVGKVDPSGERADYRNGGDVTKRLISLMHRNARTALYFRYVIGKRSDLRALWFVSMVYNNRSWDLKRKDPWRKWNVCKFRGKWVSPADVGNIHFGYVGKYYGYSDWALTNAGGIVHVLGAKDKAQSIRVLVRIGVLSSSAGSMLRKIGYFEPPRDKEMIRWGIRLMKSGV